MKTVLLALTLLLLTTLPGMAHDYWLAPEAFIVQPGTVVKTHLYFGDRFKAEDERPFQKSRTPYFKLVTSTGETDLTTTPDGRKPIAELNLTTGGTYLLGLERNPQNITLKGADFNAYLVEDGLTDILARRRRKRQLASVGRERYSRNIKALLQAGDLPDDTATRTLGQRIEIVPTQNPYSLKPGEPFTVRVRFEGKPLPGRQVNAYSLREGKLTVRTGRTDAGGNVTFRLDEPGTWMIRLVYMRPCKQDCTATDWESFWSSLTFALNSAPTQAGGR